MKCEILRPEFHPFLACDLAAGETVRACTGAMTAAQSGIRLDSSGSEMALDGYDYLLSDDLYLLQTITAQKASRVYLTHVDAGELRILTLPAEESWIINRRNFLAASSEVRIDMQPEDLTEQAGLSVLQISGPGTLVLGGFGAFLDLHIGPGESYDVDAGQIAAWQAPAANWRTVQKQHIQVASEAAAISGETYLAHFDGPAEVLVQSGRADS